MSQTNVDLELSTEKPKKPLNLFGIVGTASGILGTVLALIFAGLFLTKKPTQTISDDSALYQELFNFQANLSKYAPYGTEFLTQPIIAQLGDRHSALVKKCKASNEKSCAAFVSTSLSYILKPHFEATIRNLLSSINNPILKKTKDEIKSEIELLLKTQACEGTQYVGKSFDDIYAQHSALLANPEEVVKRHKELEDRNLELVKELKKAQGDFSNLQDEKNQLHQKYEELKASDKGATEQKESSDAPLLKLKEEKATFERELESLKNVAKENETLKVQLKALEQTEGKDADSNTRNQHQIDKEKLATLEKDNSEKAEIIKNLETRVLKLEKELEYKDKTFEKFFGR